MKLTVKKLKTIEENALADALEVANNSEKIAVALNGLAKSVQKVLKAIQVSNEKKKKK